MNYFIEPINFWRARGINAARRTFKQLFDYLSVVVDEKSAQAEEVREGNCKLQLFNDPRTKQ